MKKYAVVGAVLFLGIVFLIAMSISVPYHGTEFCPQTFEIRSFSYFKNGFGPRNMDRGSPSNACGVSIIKHLMPATTTIRWDLVSGENSRVSKDGDSNILVKYLQASNVATTWDLSRWSDDHPEIAAKLWPKIQWLAIHNLYFAIPELIRYSQREVTDDELQEFADKQALQAAVQQSQYFLDSTLSADQEILLFRLTQWLDTQAKQVAATGDKELSNRYDAFIQQAKQRDKGLQDGMLSNEQIVPQVQSTVAPAPAPVKP